MKRTHEGYTSARKVSVLKEEIPIQINKLNMEPTKRIKGSNPVYNQKSVQQKNTGFNV